MTQKAASTPVFVRGPSVDGETFSSGEAVHLWINLEVYCIFSGVNLPAVNLLDDYAGK